MNPAVKAAVIAALKANAALVALLGGQYVYPGHVSATQQIPGLYVTGSESSSTLPGYQSTGRRRCSPLLQVDAFHAGTALQADTLAAAVDPVLFAGVTGTGAWTLESRTEQFEEDTRLHHRTSRYALLYTLQD